MKGLLVLAAAIVTAQIPEATPENSGRILWSSGRVVVLDKEKTEIAVGQTLAPPLPGERVFLILRDMSTREQPGVVFRIYLHSSPGAETMIGSINFFNLARSIDSTPDPAAGSVRRFEITDLARKLKGKMTISIRASQSPEPRAEAKIGRLDVVVSR